MHALLCGIWYLAYSYGMLMISIAISRLHPDSEWLSFSSVWSYQIGKAIDNNFGLKMNGGPFEKQLCWKHHISCQVISGESWTEWVSLVKLSHQRGRYALWRVTSFGEHAHRVPFPFCVKLIFWRTKTGLAKTEPVSPLAMPILWFWVLKCQLTFSVLFFHLSWDEESDV